MEFKLSTEYSFADLLAWQRLYAKRRKLWLRILSLVFWAGVLAYCAYSSYRAIRLMLFGYFDVYILLLIVLDALLLFLCFMRYRINAWLAKRNTVKNTGALHYTINDEGIQYRANKGEGRYYYDGITELLKDKDRLYILLDKWHAMLLAFSNFGSVEPSELDRKSVV